MLSAETAFRNRLPMKLTEKRTGKKIKWTEWKEMAKRKKEMEIESTLFFFCFLSILLRRKAIFRLFSTKFNSHFHISFRFVWFGLVCSTFQADSLRRAHCNNHLRKNDFFISLVGTNEEMLNSKTIFFFVVVDRRWNRLLKSFYKLNWTRNIPSVKKTITR